jgi:hypothetical protein
VRFQHLTWWLLSAIGLAMLYTRVLRRRRKWSVTRRYYATIVALSTAVFLFNGLRAFSKNAELAYWGTVMLGVMFVSWATIPCSIEMFNSPPYVRRMRDVFWVLVGLFVLLSQCRMK